MTVGDHVIYDGVRYTIEKDYGNGVFFIGNADSFADLVNDFELILVTDIAEQTPATNDDAKGT